MILLKWLFSLNVLQIHDHTDVLLLNTTSVNIHPCSYEIKAAGSRTCLPNLTSAPPLKWTAAKAIIFCLCWRTDDPLAVNLCLPPGAWWDLCVHACTCLCVCVHLQVSKSGVKSLHESVSSKFLLKLCRRTFKLSTTSFNLPFQPAFKGPISSPFSDLYFSSLTLVKQARGEKR